MATSNNNNNNKTRTGSRHEVVNMLPTMDQRHLRAPPDEGQIKQATANASVRRGMRRNRTKYSKAQLDILEATFDRSHYPDAITVDKLATLLHLTIEKISIWFQNRRARYKRTRKNGAKSPVAKAAEGRLDINELARLLNYNHEEDGGDEDEEGSNTLYDENSVMSQAATEASETSFDQALKQQQQQQQQRSSRSLGEIKNELLSADEDSRSSYTMAANYAAAAAPSYSHRMEPTDNSNSGYGGEALSSGNHCYYNGHFTPYPAAVSHPEAYYHHSYYSNLSTVPSIDTLVHQDASSGSGSAAEQSAYPYAFYPNHFSTGFFGYPHHSSAAAAAAAAAASYFSYQHYQQTPTYEYAGAYPPSSTLSGYNLAAEEPSQAAMLPSPAPSSGSTHSTNSDAASSEQPDSPGDADADDSHAASPAPQPEAPQTSEHYSAYY